MTVLPLFLFAALAASAPPAENHEPETPLVQANDQDPFVRCTRCRNAGAKPCPEHRTLDLDLEAEVEYCSFVADCPTCLGAGWVDCADCENPAVEARMQAKRARVAELAPEMAALDGIAGRTLRKFAAGQMSVVCEVDSWKVGKKRLDDHELGHLYTRRVADLMRSYQSVLHAVPEDFEKRVLLLMWGWLEDHEEGSRRFCEISGKSGVKLLGAKPVYSVPVVRRFYDNDEQLHRNVIHSVGHLILSHQNPAYWIGNQKGGWADEGVAHWFEERVDGVIDNYCYQEVDDATRVLWNGGNWRTGLRQLQIKGKLPSMAELLEQNSDTLTPEQHALSFGVMDYLITTDAAKTNEMLKLLRGRTSNRDALRTVFGLSPLQLEERVREWIEAQYPVR